MVTSVWPRESCLKISGCGPHLKGLWDHAVDEHNPASDYKKINIGFIILKKDQYWISSYHVSKVLLSI